MTVAELIAELQKHEPDAKAYTLDENGYCEVSVTESRPLRQVPGFGIVEQAGFEDFGPIIDAVVIE